MWSQSNLLISVTAITVQELDVHKHFTLQSKTMGKQSHPGTGQSELPQYTNGCFGLASVI